MVKSPDDIEKWAPLVGAIARGVASLAQRRGAKALSARAGRVAARKPPGSVPTPPSLKPTKGMSRRQAYSSAWDGKNAPPGTFEGKGNFRNVTKPNIGETPDKFGGFSPDMNTAFSATNQSFAKPPGLFERGKVAVSNASNAASDKLLGAGQRVSDIGRAGEKGLLDAGQRVSDAVGAAGDVAVRGTQSALDAGGRAIEGAGKLRDTAERGLLDAGKRVGEWSDAAGPALGDVAVRTGEKAWGAGKGIADATGKVARGTLDRSLPYLAPGADKSIWRPGGQIVGDFMSGERGQGLANWAGETAGRISESPIGQIGRNITSQGDALREGAGKFTDKYKEGLVGVTGTGGGGGSASDNSAAKGAQEVATKPLEPTQHMGDTSSDNPNLSPSAAYNEAQSGDGTTFSHVRSREQSTPATVGDVRNVADAGAAAAGAAAAAGEAKTQGDISRQSKWGAGLMGASMIQGRRAEARAKQEAETQRLMQERQQQSGGTTTGSQMGVAKMVAVI